MWLFKECPRSSVFLQTRWCCAGLTGLCGEGTNTAHVCWGKRWSVLLRLFLFWVDDVHEKLVIATKLGALQFTPLRTGTDNRWFQARAEPHDSSEKTIYWVNLQQQCIIIIFFSHALPNFNKHILMCMSDLSHYGQNVYSPAWWRYSPGICQTTFQMLFIFKCVFFYRLIAWNAVPQVVGKSLWDFVMAGRSEDESVSNSSGESR